MFISGFIIGALLWFSFAAFSIMQGFLLKTCLFFEQGRQFYIKGVDNQANDYVLILTQVPKTFTNGGGVL